MNHENKADGFRAASSIVKLQGSTGRLLSCLAFHSLAVAQGMARLEVSRSQRFFKQNPKKSINALGNHISHMGAHI